MAQPLEEKFLQKTNDLIEKNLYLDLILRQEDPQIALKRVARHLCISQNAKRIRPLMVLYFYWLKNSDTPNELIKIAVAAEFIHAASLMHDDIVDNAERRRGKLSANNLFGNNIAVLGGDYLLTEAFLLIKDFHKSLTDRAITAVREMTKAAMQEILTRSNTLIEKKTWQQIALGKTGVLFSWCGFAAQNFNGPGTLDKMLWRAGIQIGIIFQIADDIKDFSGDNNLKDLCRDIRNKALSLPIILAMENPNIKNKFENAFTQNEISQELATVLNNLVLDSGAVEKAKKIMLDELYSLGDSLSFYNGSIGKTCIENWMEKII